jgi:subtilisin family serine protease
MLLMGDAAMHMSTRIVLSVVIGLAVVVSSPHNRACAGRISSGLEQRMAQAAPNELVPVIIRAIGTVPGSVLQKQVATQFHTRKQRHQAAVEGLQTTAKTAQVPILRALNSSVYAGRVRNVKGFWIDNVIIAEMTPSAIAELANRPDIDEVLYLPPVDMMKSADDVQIGGPADVAAAGRARPCLRAIKADKVWKMGYTGKGRLVASIDTGVDGDHVFLRDKWRGNNGYTVRESWFNPQTNDAVPRPLSDAHGTWVMGLMVAVQDLEASGDPYLDTLGVAYDAQWISAGVIDVTGASILEAMQWIADPDGDPNTELDVPDAVANAWGVIASEIDDPCIDVFWNAIDNVEAAGAAMIFAAGNEGLAGPQTIRNPANRATSETNSFAVGMIDPHDPAFTIEPRSSRGPSICNGTEEIKPNVVAPGDSLKSVHPGNFTVRGIVGTSFSTPLVAGGIALLREYNPNATVKELKTALMNSAVDLGDAGADNVYGHGLVDLEAAINLLPPNDQPALYIKHDYYNYPPPGGTGQMVIMLRSAGAPVNNVSVTVVSEHPQLTVVQGTAAFGDFALVGDSARNFNEPFVLDVGDDVLEGERLPMRFEISGDGGYSRVVHGALQVGPEREVELYTHTAGNFQMTVSAFGMFGLQLDGINPRAGAVGYLYGDDPTETLFEGAFMVGTDANHVSDNARDRLSFPDFDFQVDPGGRLDTLPPDREFAEETRAAFSDAIAENPIGLFIEQRTMVSDEPDADDYLVAEYTIHNRSGTTLTDLRPGLYFDWDFPWLSGNQDTVGFDLSSSLAWMRSRVFDQYRGIAVLTQPGVTSYRGFNNEDDIFVEGFTEQLKWESLTYGTADTAKVRAGDRSILVATGPFTLAPDEAVVVAFAIIGATSEDSLKAYAANALELYRDFVLHPSSVSFAAVEDDELPADQTFSIENLSTETVDFSVEDSTVPSWITLSPSAVSIPSGDSEEFTIGLQMPLPQVGNHNESITISTSLLYAPTITLPISLQVTSPPDRLQLVEPNPFDPSEGEGVVRLLAPVDGRVRVAIYDVTGEEVVTLTDVRPADHGNAVEWDGRNSDNKVVASGVYIGRVEAIDVSWAQNYKIVLRN